MEALMRSNDGEYEHREARKHQLRLIFRTECSFNCPICGGWQSVVCELDDYELNFQRVVPKRMACVECGFVVGDKQPFMTRALL
jgi:transcription elongation factor Elf1